MKKIVNIETAPGKFVPTQVDSKNNPEHFEKELTIEEVQIEIEVKEEPKKKRTRAKKTTNKE